MSALSLAQLFELFVAYTEDFVYFFTLLGTPDQQRILTSPDSGLVCRQLLFSAGNGSMHGPATEAKVHQLITMCEDFFKYQQGFFSRAFISSTLEALNDVLDSAAFQKFLGGAKRYVAFLSETSFVAANEGVSLTSHSIT